MLIAGLVLIVIGVIAGGVGYFQHRKLMDLVSVETSTVAELRELADAVNQTEEAAGAFSQRCEVVGAAKSANGGLDAPNSNQKCVWYRTQVTEKYWDYEWVGEGNNRRQQRVERTRTLQDSHSEFDFQHRRRDRRAGRQGAQRRRRPAAEGLRPVHAVEPGLRRRLPGLLRQLADGRRQLDRPPDRGVDRPARRAPVRAGRGVRGRRSAHAGQGRQGPLPRLAAFGAGDDQVSRPLAQGERRSRSGR